MNEKFGNWFSGLVDGEGCFSLPVPSKYTIPHPRFDLTMRADDIRMLEQIKSTLGFGQIYSRKHGYKNSQGYTSKLLASYVVWNKSDTLKLVELFREFPLRSKKSRDFTLWAEAVEIWNLHKYGRWADTPETLPLKERMRELAVLIKDIRVYVPPD